MLGRLACPVSASTPALARLSACSDLSSGDGRGLAREEGDLAIGASPVVARDSAACRASGTLPAMADTQKAVVGRTGVGMTLPLKRCLAT